MNFGLAQAPAELCAPLAGRELMNKNECTITIKWPWTMIPLEVADEWIDHVRNIIGPGHPLHGKEIFPDMRREDGRRIVLFDNDTDGTYVLVDFEKSHRYQRKLMPAATIISTASDLQRQIDHDHDLAMKTPGGKNQPTSK